MSLKQSKLIKHIVNIIVARMGDFKARINQNNNCKNKYNVSGIAVAFSTFKQRYFVSL